MRRLLFLSLTVLSLLVLGGCSHHKAVRSEQDLDGARVGVLTGLGHRQALEASFPDAQWRHYEDLPSMCLALQGRKIDALVCVGPGLDLLLDTHPSFVELPFRTFPDSMAVAFRLQDDTLAAQFDEFLHAARSDGLLAEVDANWFGPEAPRSFYHQHVHAGTPLRVGIEVGQSGLTVMEDGEETGFEPELMRRFADHLGRPVHFVEMTGAGMLPALMSGRVEALVDAITPTPDRRANVRFSEPYYRGTLHLVTLSPDGGLLHRRHLGGSLRQNLLEEGRYLLILKGLWITLLIMACSLLLGSVLGAGLCWMRVYGKPWARKAAHSYCDFIESIPVVVLLLFMFYVVFASSSVAAVVVAVITYSLHFSAGACESFVEGLRTVPMGQYEAARALGFTEWQALRYVVLPQAARAILLLFKGRSVALIENTSIVGFIAIQDLTKVTDIIRTQTYDSLVPLVVVGLLYFLLAKLIGWGIDKLGDFLLKR